MISHLNQRLFATIFWGDFVRANSSNLMFILFPSAHFCSSFTSSLLFPCCRFLDILASVVHKDGCQACLKTTVYSFLQCCHFLFDESIPDQAFSYFGLHCLQLLLDLTQHSFLQQLFSKRWKDRLVGY